MRLVKDMQNNATKAQMVANNTKYNYNLDKNPPHKALKVQQQVVEEAIKHLAMIHRADLNGSVVQVECMVRWNRLEDIERIISDCLEREWNWID